MKAVFADTSYYLALVNSLDQYHSAVCQWTSGFAGTSITTAWVIAELANAMSQTGTVLSIVVTRLADGCPSDNCSAHQGTFRSRAGALRTPIRQGLVFDGLHFILCHGGTRLEGGGDLGSTFCTRRIRYSDTASLVTTHPEMYTY